MTRLAFAVAGLLTVLPTAAVPARAESRAGPDPIRALVDDGTWIQLSTPGRSGHTVVGNPGRDRMILFAGSDPVIRNDLWWMPLGGEGSWSPLYASGTRPSARQHHTAIHDPVRDRMIVFGGSSSLVRFNDLWTLSLAEVPEWQQLTASGTPPTARTGHAALYDPIRDRMLVFGGHDGANPMNDVWELTLSGTPQWSLLAPSGSPPPARYHHGMIYDPVRDRLVFSGGQVDGVGTQIFDDAWQLTLSGTPAWSPIVAGGTPPGPHTLHVAIYDSHRDGMLIFSLGTLSELLFQGSPTWTPLSSFGAPYEARAVLYDASRQRMVVIDGRYDLIRREHERRGLSISTIWPGAGWGPRRRSAGAGTRWSMMRRTSR